ncbi:MAG: NUDIX domain-containing protein [bacterium]
MKDDYSIKAKIQKKDAITPTDEMLVVKIKGVRSYVIYVDIRNFSQWNNLEGNNDHFRKILLYSFYKIIEKYFPRDKNYRKFLGDGVFIIKDYREEEFDEVISSLKMLKDEFDKKKKELNKEGFNFDLLSLGIGMSVGFIKEIIYPSEEVDYMEYFLNLTSRYCDFARPCGIIIDYTSTLKHTEKIEASGFRKEVLTGIKGFFAGKKVWCSNEVHLPQIHPLTREDEIHQIEVYVAGVCVRREDVLKILVGKRNNKRRLYPGLWECGGGQVHRREYFEEAIKRQFREEFGVIVEPLKAFGSYKIDDRENDAIIPGIKFLCRFVDYLDDQVILNEAEFVEYRWILLEELDLYEFIPGIKEDIREAIRLYQEILG